MRKRMTIKVWVFVVALAGALLVGTLMGQSGKPAKAAIPPPVVVTETLHVPAPAAPVAAAQPPAPEPKGPATTIGNGTWEVGVDVALGTYVSAAPEQGTFTLCYFDVKQGDKFLDQGTAREGQSRVKLDKPGSEFKSSGCEDWVKK